jgi:putative phage-type endonuclease
MIESTAAVPTSLHKVPGLSFTDSELRARRDTLGASEIPAVAGLSKYASAWHVWAQKKGLIPASPATTYTEWGHRLERVIVDAYAERVGVAVTRGVRVRHPVDEWMSATPDALCLPEAGDEYGLEAKNRSAYVADDWGPSGTDLVPDDVAAQCHWSMLVSGLRRWDVAVLIGGNELRHYTLRYDATIAASLEQIGRHFWHAYVLANVEPVVRDGRGVEAYLAAKHGSAHSATVREGTADEFALVRRLQAVRGELARLEADEAQLVLAIKGAIGTDAGVTFPDGSRATWKTEGGRVAWKAVAEALGAPRDLIERNTAPGARTFRVHVPKAKAASVEVSA